MARPIAMLFSLRHRVFCDMDCEELVAQSNLGRRLTTSPKIVLPCTHPQMNSKVSERWSNPYKSMGSRGLRAGQL